MTGARLATLLCNTVVRLSTRPTGLQGALAVWHAPWAARLHSGQRPGLRLQPCMRGVGQRGPACPHHAGNPPLLCLLCCLQVHGERGQPAGPVRAGADHCGAWCRGLSSFVECGGWPRTCASVQPCVSCVRCRHQPCLPHEPAPAPPSAIPSAHLLRPLPACHVCFACRFTSPLGHAAVQETASAAGHEGEPMLQCFF